MQRTDAELVNAASHGDVESFRELYDRYYALAVGIARSRVADRHLAEDAAQEAFAVACRRLHSIRDGSRFSAWLAVICRRTAMRMSRSHRNSVPFKDEPTTGAVQSDDTTSSRVIEAIGRLSVSAREVIQLHYYSGLSHEEIARTLKTTPQAVHGRLQRARSTLAKWLRASNV